MSIVAVGQTYDALKIGICDFQPFQRPITPKFWGQEKTDPPMTQSRPPAFIWYRFHGCGLRSLWVYKRTKSKKRAWRTDRRTSPKLYPFASRGILFIGMYHFIKCSNKNHEKNQRPKDKWYFCSYVRSGIGVHTIQWGYLFLSGVTVKPSLNPASMSATVCTAITKFKSNKEETSSRCQELSCPGLCMVWIISIKNE